MIVYKKWVESVKYKYIDAIKYVVTREGWFLFGFIPLYIRDVTTRS
jgi:hypothetical protein